MFKLDYFIISMSNPWKAAFDNIILIVIGYTCLTTVLFISFDSQKNDTLNKIDHVVTASFMLDIIFNLMMEYQDKETFQKVRDHKKIAIKYFKSGWLPLDFIATFPFDLVFNSQAQYTRMIRLMRLSKLIAVLDTSRFKRIIKAYYENSTRADRFQSLYIVMYTYKIFRLIIIIFLITYFIGCFWWLLARYVNTPQDIEKGNTFIEYF